MKFEAMPIIRIELEGIKQSIIQHIGAAGSEYGELVAEQLEKAILTYPWEDTVRRTTERCIDEAIENYFKCGDGAKAIREAVNTAFRND